jgi:hypothetical protein
MEMLESITAHWFDLLQTAGILVGLFATVHTIRAETNERRIGNLFALTKAHREIWSRLYDREELGRVLAPVANLSREPATPEEELFVHSLILHLRMAFKARDLGMQFDDDAVEADIRQFFSRPIPRAVWDQTKAFQDRRFVEFVDRALESGDDLETAA